MAPMSEHPPELSGRKLCGPCFDKLWYLQGEDGRSYGSEEALLRYIKHYYNNSKGREWKKKRKKFTLEELQAEAVERIRQRKEIMNHWLADHP